MKFIVDNLETLRMPEAEVSLRLAIYLLESGLTNGQVEVAIDGAQVRTLEQIHFPMAAFLANASCECISPPLEWRGTYLHGPSSGRIQIHSYSGRGDVVAKLSNGHNFRAESKKGPLVGRRGSPEYPLLREALGQLITIEQLEETDILAVAVPHSARFAALAARWRKAPLIPKLGSKF